MSGRKENNELEVALQQIDSEAMTREEIEELLGQIRMDDFLDMEMARLGFWDPNKKSEGEQTIAELQKESNVLQERLRELQRDYGERSDIEARIRQDREARIQASKERYRLRRLHAKEQFEKQKRKWAEQKKTDIVHLGEEVSNHLSSTQISPSKLDLNQVPHVASVPDLAELLGVSVPTLRKLSYHRRVSRYNAYVRFSIPKKSGGVRIISAPRPELKAVQTQILEKILSKVPIHEAAHGFRKNCSILTNALPHVGKSIVVNMDLENFFPTLNFPRVRGCFTNLGYSPKIATILALLCTEAEVGEYRRGEQLWFVRKSTRHLPQGAPSSPAITNIVCHSLDRRLSGLAQASQWTYTRYADDLTFSHTNRDAYIYPLLENVQQIVESEDFKVHPRKTKVMRPHTTQEVTGVVVNVKPSVSRKERKRFKALVHRLETKGPDACHWKDSEDVLSAALGFAAHIKSIDPEKGEPLLKRVKSLCEKYR